MVRQLEGQVSAAGIDDVAETLRDMFAGEREALRDDIEWLQGCADQVRGGETRPCCMG